MMKGFFSLLLLTILIESVEAQIDSITKQNTSIYTNEKNSKQLKKRDRDKIIIKNLPGNWNWHDGVWQFEPNGTMSFFFLDTLRTSGIWNVKNGILYTVTTWPVKQSVWRNVIIYCSNDTLQFKRPDNIYPDRINTMQRIKE